VVRLEQSKRPRPSGAYQVVPAVGAGIREDSSERPILSWKAHRTREKWIDDITAARTSQAVLPMLRANTTTVESEALLPSTDMYLRPPGSLMKLSRNGTGPR